jgi:inner membrane protein
MRGHSHLTIGVVTYASLWLHPLGALPAPLFAESARWAVLPVGIVAVAFGSLLPDIDHPGSTLAHERVLGVPVFKPFSWGISTIFGHRGPTHSLLALAALLALGQWPGLPWAWLNLGWLIGWGFALHLLADALTKAGIPLFWPLRARFGIPPLHQLRFTTGTWPEALIVFLLTAACFFNAFALRGR